MRLLFNQNISVHLVGSLSDVYPGSTHVSLIGLDRATDAEVFNYALDNGYALVSKDVDFAELAQEARRPSPKVVWLRLGNCTTSEIEETLRARQEAVAALESDPEAKVLALGQ
jgi:predicted nuclease of predicted toxin-antitoxin system